MTGPACSRCGKPEIRSRRLCKCSHPGCPDPAHTRGLCRRHTWQAARYGQVIDLPHIWSPPGAWTTQAACAAEPDLMFSDDYRSITEAKRVCAACPVRPECLSYALDNAEPFGIWGGLTTEERAAITAGKRDAA